MVSLRKTILSRSSKRGWCVRLLWPTELLGNSGERAPGGGGESAAAQATQDKDIPYRTEYEAEVIMTPRGLSLFQPIPTLRWGSRVSPDSSDVGRLVRAGRPIIKQPYCIAATRMPETDEL